MQCSLSNDRLKSCSEYKLNITQTAFDSFEKYTCLFETSHLSNSCECKIEVKGFVITEKFTITLLEGTNVLLNKPLMSTQDFIKPKTPALTVERTENGNFKVTWDDQYKKSGGAGRNFLDDLKINLTYSTKEGREPISRVLQNTAGSFEIVGKNLHPKTNYILTATMSTDYNDHTISSDQSAPVEFTTSSSPKEIAKMLIPPLCVGLIIIIVIIFICVLRMKRNWWDKISKPKIDSNLGDEKGHILPPPDMKFSQIHVEFTKLDLQEKNKLISTLSEDTNNEKSSHSVESAPVDYGQACSGSPEENINVAKRVEHALDEVFKQHPITNNKSLLSPNNKVTTIGPYNRVNVVSSSRECNRANRDSGNCSGSSVFSNMSYLESTTDDSLFLEQLSDDHYRQSSKREVSDSSDSQFNSPTIDTLEVGYQCFNSVLDKDADVCVNISDDADDKCITKNLITSTNPLYPSLILHDGSVTPSDDGYQAFQGLTKSTEGQWSTEPTMVDFKCFNDYETEMQCSFSTDRLKNCSEYMLNITETTEKYTCIFERSNHSDSCECKIKVQVFVTAERFSITLLEGTNVLSKASMTTEEFIKPKTPVVKVLKNDSGNFIVTWNDQYEKNGLLGQFLQNLRINLTYEGGHENITRVLQNTVGSFEIVGKNLKPNTKYILTATMSTDYNAHTISSDQSAPVEFTTSSSPNEIAKILIPPLCVGLIIIILIIFISVLSMKRNWWDKISKPKIDANLGEEKDHILPLSVMEFSPIHVEISTLDLQEENKLISAVSVDTNNGRSSHSIETTPVKYGQACSGSQEENICTINIPSCVEHALDEVFKLHPITKNLLPPNNQVTTIRSYSSVNIVHSSRECNSANQDSGSSSGPMVFSNMSYVESATDDSLYVEHLSEDYYHQSSKREVSDSSNGQFNSPTIDTLEDEYQGFNSVLNKRNDSDVRVNLSNDAVFSVPYPKK
ncbi:interleukin-4 receptor subunit alpha-like protein [Labeo rohita]|uniref:Interleukin-4 receptor subunit alpha-like protein n=1 Tax=Labeo rohita TaxID=84645 RepID=A0A498LQQ3_LABRO|nr:interleukin-4 receptor subunit alpha-like protein [Labeo rohita]